MWSARNNIFVVVVVTGREAGVDVWIRLDQLPASGSKEWALV